MREQTAVAMTPEQQREVWEMLDRDHLADVARKGPEPIFATLVAKLLEAQ